MLKLGLWTRLGLGHGNQLIIILTFASTKKLNAMSPNPTAVKVKGSTSISKTLTSSSSPFSLASSAVCLLTRDDCSTTLLSLAEVDDDGVVNEATWVAREAIIMQSSRNN